MRVRRVEHMVDKEAYLKFRMALTRAAVMIEEGEIDLTNIRADPDVP